MNCIPLLTFEFIGIPIGAAVTPVGDLRLGRPRRFLRSRRKDRCRFDDHGFGQVSGVKSQGTRCQQERTAADQDDRLGSMKAPHTTPHSPFRHL
ncbi:MAG: hypothetical protein E3J30_04565 [Anaerolineales bacterium]|nr:MAG: hypothetical protein E3J30_04565 [Anaerolineales bacterium]